MNTTARRIRRFAAIAATTTLSLGLAAGAAHAATESDNVSLSGRGFSVGAGLVPFVGAPGTVTWSQSDFSFGQANPVNGKLDIALKADFVDNAAKCAYVQVVWERQDGSNIKVQQSPELCVDSIDDNHEIRFTSTASNDRLFRAKIKLFTRRGTPMPATYTLTDSESNRVGGA